MAQEDDWQPGPSWPFRVGLATPGFGIGIGCGAGIGFPSAKLGAIPIIGPAVLSGLALLPGPVAGFATEARRQLLQALGVKWLDAGMGCGVGLGYGYGGGIVLKPSAAEELATMLQSLAGRATAFVQHGLQQGGVKTETGSAASSAPSMMQQSGTSGPVHMTVGLPQGAMTSSVPDQLAALTSNVPGKGAGLGQGASAGAGIGGGAAATSLPGLGLSIAGLGNGSPGASPGPSGAGVLPGSQVMVKGQGGVGALPSLLAAQQVLSLLITQQQQLEGLSAAAGVMQAQLGEMADRLSKQEREMAELRAALLAVSDALQQGSDEGAVDVAAKHPAGRGGGKGRGSVLYPPTNLSLIRSHRTSWTNPHLFWIGHTIHTHLAEASKDRHLSRQRNLPAAATCASVIAVTQFQPRGQGSADTLMHLLLEPSFSALRRVQPFAAAPRPLGARHAVARSRCSLLARRVQQAERDVEAPPAPPSPQSPEHATPAAAPAPTAENLQHDAAAPSSAAADAQPPSHGPRLPPRPARQQQKQPSPEPRRPFPFQRPGAAAILATYGAYIGAVGTLAVGTAWLTDVHLASMFRWSPDVVQSALLAFAPLAAFNTLIMLPDYSTWALPKLDGKDPEGEAVLMQSQGIAGASKGKQQDGAAAAAAAAEAGQQGRAADAAAGSDIAAASTTVASSAAAAEGASTSGSSGAGSADAQPSPSQHVAKVPASAWGQKKPPMRILKDAMHLAQGHYTANNPTIDLNPAFEVVTTTAQALAGEMLYRGVAITLLTQWLADRFYEAGADDMVMLPLSSTLMDTHEAAQWTAAWLLVAVSFGLALRKVYAAPRPRVVSMIDLRQAARKQGGGSAASDAPASASDGTPSPAPGVRDAEGPLKPRAPQPGWMPQGFQQVTTLAAAIQGARNCSQTLIFNCLFVATGGNLAATFTASLANQLLFSALQRSSMERMQKRSASLAKELEALNRRLMEIQRKKTARASAAAAAAVAEVEADAGVRMARRGAVEEAGEAGSAGTEQGSEVSVLSASAANEQRREEATAAGPSVSAAAEEHLAVTAAVAAAAQPQQGQALLHAAANAAANAAADLSGEAASVQPAVAAAAAGGGGGDGRAPDQLTRALMALELLLPTEPTAASPSKGQAK